MRFWYLIRSKPRAECIAQTHLERQGFHVYFPRMLRPARIRGHWVDRVEPLFPRYLFLESEAGTSVGPVRSTVGVAEIVRFGTEYARVPEDVIHGLMAGSEIIMHEFQRPLFMPGIHVRVAEGPFKGLDGIFECGDGEKRVAILLEVLGRQTRVCMSVNQVIPQVAA